MESIRYDLLVIGGGINGVGIARDAAGRGLSVLLCEKDDLAAHTSSASTKLIHGGLRYLEYKQFGLVRKALQEREVLLRAAPHIMRPLRFVMPHMPSLRPAWLIRAGLFLYDHLACRKQLSGSGSINLHHHPAGAPLIDSLTRGFIYSDGWVDDARLVVLNALDAAERGARIATRTTLISATRENGQWRAQLQCAGKDAPFEARARAIVNAAGPWAARLHAKLGQHSQHGIRLVKGSHIVTRRLFEHEHAYILQNRDGRIVFAIPYEQDYTLIGTTDVEYHGDPAHAAITSDETRYLCEAVNRYFKTPISPSDVCWSYAGVRPLLAEEATATQTSAPTLNPAALTRDYLLELDTGSASESNSKSNSESAPLLSVFGGKITTYRRLAEEALDRLSTALALNTKPWSAEARLPGGDIGQLNQLNQFEPFAARFAAAYPWLPAALARRYASAYGTRASHVIGAAQSLAELGRAFAPGLYENELRYLREVEWARTAEDVLWRRSKLGLHIGATALRSIYADIDQWFAAQTRPCSDQQSDASSP